MPNTKKYNIVNVRVFDGEELIPDHVVINGEKFGGNKDVRGSEIIDGNGGVLIPGLIDCHVHLSDVKELETMRDYGVTSAMDMETWPLEKINALRGLDGLPDVRSAGVAAHYNRYPANVLSEASVETPDAAHMFVAHRASEGFDFIKIISDPPQAQPGQKAKRGIDRATMEALVTAAHQHSMLTIAHATDAIGFNLSLDTGVDIITHAPLSKGLDGGNGEISAIARMAALTPKRVVVPTLIMMKGTAENRPLPGYEYETSKMTVGALHKVGVPILAGTDANTNAKAPFKPKHGEDLHTELMLLVEAGLSPVEALRAATVLPSLYFRLTDRGIISPGYRADMVLLSGDPTTNIENTRKVERVWIAGEMFMPKKSYPKPAVVA